MALTIIVMWLVTCTSQSKATLWGHMHPIGNQKPTIIGRIDEFSYMIPASVFYQDYWIPAKPVIFRGVINHAAAMKNWKNEPYMKKQYGSVFGVVDRRTTWTRGGVESPPRCAMNYSEFLDRLRREQLYWDDQIPTGHRILEDVPMGIFFDCSELRKQVLYINLMVNSGNVSYVLHSDYADNLFHFIAGKKRWLVANSTFRDLVYMGNNTQTNDMSPVVPSQVDLIKFPRMSEVDFHEIYLLPGDILYIPRDWPHYVESTGSPNIGLNVWFGSEMKAARAPKVPECKRQHVSAWNLLNRKKRKEKASS